MSIPENTIKACFAPHAQSQVSQKDRFIWDEENRLLKQLLDDMARLWGESTTIEQTLILHEETATAHQEMAIRLWESKLTYDNKEKLLKERQERREIWMSAINDWSEGIECAKRGLQIARGIAMCHKRLHKLRIERNTKLGGELKNVEQGWKTYMMFSRSATGIDNQLLGNKIRFLECKENFRKWDLHKPREWEEKSLEGCNTGKWEDEKRYMEKARYAIEDEWTRVEEQKIMVDDAMRVVDRQKRAIMKEWGLIEQERDAMEQERLRGGHLEAFCEERR